MAVAALAGALCGLLGVFVVLRGMSYIGHGLSHAIFGGAVASYVTGHQLLHRRRRLGVRVGTAHQPGRAPADDRGRRGDRRGDDASFAVGIALIRTAGSPATSTPRCSATSWA